MTEIRKINLEELKVQIKANENVPKHVAIIMDGNGRWAKTRGYSRMKGHRVGIDSVREIVRFSPEVGVETLTLYTFSKENWNRPRQEISALMKLLLRAIRKEVDDLMENNVQVRTIGNLQDLPPDARQGMEEAIERTRNNTGLILNLAISYSSRSEIIQGIRSMLGDIQKGVLAIEDISESRFASYLYTADLRDPDLLIRTGGESRISNFLLWQLAYTEIYITPVPWPEFRKVEFAEALLDYQTRERRFGMVSEQLKKDNNRLRGLVQLLTEAKH